MDTNITRDEIIGSLDRFRPEGMPDMGWQTVKGRFIRSVMPQFKTVSELYRADAGEFARTHGRFCGEKTVQLWNKVKEWIYCETRQREAACDMKRMAEKAAADLREAEDPWISKEQFRKMLDLCELLGLRGVRYRRFTEFIRSIEESDEGKEG